MKIKIAVLLISALAFSQSSASPDFDRLDAAITRSAKIKTATVEKKIAWNAEKARLEALENSYAGLLKSKREKLDKIEAENKVSRGNCDVLLRKIERDELALEKASAFLDLKYMQIIANPEAAKILGDSDAAPKNFPTKTLPEKVRAIMNALSVLESADKSVVRDGEKKSTGVFVKAEGADCKPIAVLKVDRNGAAK